MESVSCSVFPAVALDVAVLRNVQSAHLSDDYAARAQWHVWRLPGYYIECCTERATSTCRSTRGKKTSTGPTS